MNTTASSLQLQSNDSKSPFSSQVVSQRISDHHFQLYLRSTRENRPIIEFDYSDDDDDEITLTIFGRERPGLLADLTQFLNSTSLNIRHANIYSLDSKTVMDQFLLFDSKKILQDDGNVRQIHDTLIEIVSFREEKDNNRKKMERNWSNIVLREVEEEQRLEHLASRRQSEAITANFVEHALSSLVSGEYLYYYSSYIRYRHKFSLSEDKTYLSWGESNENVIRLSRYAGCIFGPKSSVFQDLGQRLVDPEWLCFSLIAKPNYSSSSRRTPQSIDLVCVSSDQLNRWFLGLQSCCYSSLPPMKPIEPSSEPMLVPSRLTLADITRLRVIYKIRAHAHARGLTVRRYVLKRVREFGLRRDAPEMFRQYTDEITHLGEELARVQKNLIDYARRETLLNTSLRDFQTSWSIDPSNLEYLHPIGRGAFSEMWKGMWRSTPVAIKCLTTHSFSGQVGGGDGFHQREINFNSRSTSSADDDGNADADKNKRKEGKRKKDSQSDLEGLSAEDRRLLQDFRLEVTMLNRLRHPNIVLFLGAVTQLPKLSILTEFCHGGSLFNALRKRSWRSCLSLQELRLVARHIARGVCYLHGVNIIHRDLKSQNLLLDRPVEEGCPVVKVADFGLSRKFLHPHGIGTTTTMQQDSSCTASSVHGVMTSETGTYRWMAPEMIRHEPYNEKVDVYSYGVVLWELFSCEIPFHSLSPIQAAYAVADRHLRPKCESDYAKSVEIPIAWKLLIERCWHKSSSQRPRFSKVLEILDEMESCDQNQIPRSLQQNLQQENQIKRGASTKKKNSGASSTFNIPLPFPTPRQSNSTGEPSNLILDTEANASSKRNRGQTGLRRSGSSPALAKLFR